MSVISAAFYFGTVGVLARGTDARLLSISQRLAKHFETRGGEGLRQEVERLLVDGIEQDTEVYLLVAPDGQPVAGNIYGWAIKKAPRGSLNGPGAVGYGRPLPTT